jgi:hypothetical protein
MSSASSRLLKIKPNQLQGSKENSGVYPIMGTHDFFIHSPREMEDLVLMGMLQLLTFYKEIEIAPSILNHGYVGEYLVLA